MSSHREAPAISKDPAADNTDVYAFVDPTDSSKVDILANFIPFEKPEGGPNFFTFGDDVLYEIKIDNDGDAKEDITYQFRFKTTVLNPDTFLYNTLPITLAGGPFAPYSESFNIRQRYKVTRIGGSNDDDDDDDDKDGVVIASNLETPPVNIGPRSIPSPPGYSVLADAAIHTVGSKKFFAGQREEAFNVDLGSIFDLGTLRPFQGAHILGSFPPNDPKDGTKGFNVHTIAMQVPKTDLAKPGADLTDPLASDSVIGIWSTASRQKATIRKKDGKVETAGKWVQVSRLANPLVNEVVIPMGMKDKWNAREPKDDEKFLTHFEHPELQTLLPFLYSTDGTPATSVFPNLAAFVASGAARADLVAILLTGIPASVTGAFGFQNFTGPKHADLLRLNLAINPADVLPPNPLGLDLHGFPNGRRITDNVVAIELRAIAGLTLPLVTSFTPDGAAGALTDGTSNEPGTLLGSFPYLGLPHQGYDHEHD